MTDRPITDLNTLVEKSVECKMKPLMTAIFVDNECTRKKIGENTRVMSKFVNRYAWVRDVAIALLYLIMLFYTTTCVAV